MNSFFFIFIFLSIIHFINNEVTQWDYLSLANYIEKNFKNEKYFICDPHNYITEDEKEVITYRLVDILNRMYYYPIIIVLNKINKTELNIESDFDDDEFNYQGINSSKLNNNNNNVNKTENTNIKNFIYNLNKKIFNGKTLSNIDDDNNVLILFYTVEEIGLYLFRGENVSNVINDNETDDLLLYRDQLIKKKKIYPAVDDVLVNILYHHAKTTSDKIYAGIGSFSEWLVFILIAGYYIYNWGKGNQVQDNNNNQNNNTLNNNNNNKENKDKKDNDKLDDKKEKKD